MAELSTGKTALVATQIGDPSINYLGANGQTSPPSDGIPTPPSSNEKRQANVAVRKTQYHNKPDWPKAAGSLGDTNIEEIQGHKNHQSSETMTTTARGIQKNDNNDGRAKKNYDDFDDISYFMITPDDLIKALQRTWKEVDPMSEKNLNWLAVSMQYSMFDKEILPLGSASVAGILPFDNKASNVQDWSVVLYPFRSRSIDPDFTDTTTELTDDHHDEEEGEKVVEVLPACADISLILAKNGVETTKSLPKFLVLGRLFLGVKSAQPTKYIFGMTEDGKLYALWASKDAGEDDAEFCFLDEDSEEDSRNAEDSGHVCGWKGLDDPKHIAIYLGRVSDWSSGGIEGFAPAAEENVAAWKSQLLKALY